MTRIHAANRTLGPDEKLKPPSRSTLYRRIEKAGIDAILRRSPSRSQRQKHGDVLLGNPVSRILERVELDHTPLHLFVVDWEDRLPIGRPRLTLATDVYSKMPLGFDLGFDHAGYAGAMRCLRHAILPKLDCQQKYGTKNPFPTYGLPETIVVDQGREFVGTNFRDALGLLGIVRENMPGRTPWYKPGIERLMRTNNQSLLEGLPGYTFGNVAALQDYDPQKDACISLEAMYELLHIFLLDIYAQRWHDGIQAVPARRWQESIDAGMIPNLNHSAEEIRIRLCASEERTLTRQGIEWGLNFYHSEGLARLRQIKDGEKIRFRYDPDDIGEIYVHDPLRGQWLTVPALDQSYARGLSLYKHRIIREYALEEKRNVNIFALVEAKKRLQDIVEREFMLTRKTRRRLYNARLRGNKGSDPAPVEEVSQAIVPVVLPPDLPFTLPDDWHGGYDLRGSNEHKF